MLRYPPRSRRGLGTDWKRRAAANQGCFSCRGNCRRVGLQQAASPASLREGASGYSHHRRPWLPPSPQRDDRKVGERKPFARRNLNSMAVGNGQGGPGQGVCTCKVGRSSREISFPGSRDRTCSRAARTPSRSPNLWKHLARERRISN